MIARLTAIATLHTRRVLICAGVLFAGTALVGLPVVGVLKSEPSEFQDRSAQNQQAMRAIEHATGQTAGYGVAALVPSARNLLSDPAAGAGAARVAALLSAQPGFQRALDYPASHIPVLLSRDARESVVLGAFATRERSVAAVAHVRGELAGTGVRFGGNDLAFNEINQRVRSDLSLAELVAFPILLLLSFWVFRGLVAALLPLLVGGFAIAITFLLLRAINELTGVSVFALNLVTGLGLGLGIDYSLFVLARYREELHGGADTATAIANTLRTAGRTVLYSALTVAAALSCLLVFPLRFLYSMGIGGMIVALSAGTVALLVLPAVLVALGPRVDALAPAWLQRKGTRALGGAAPGEGSGGVWERLARGVMRRPGLVAITTAAALLAIALPSLGLRLVPADAHVLPASSQPRAVAEALAHEFPVDGSQTISLIVHAPPDGGAGVSALARHAQLRAAGRAAIAAPPAYLGADTWQIELQPRGSEAAPANEQLIGQLRALAAPPTLLVGGDTAWFVDQKAAIAAHAALAIVILALVIGVILFLMTNSVVLPVLALAMNLLTIAVGAGLLVEIFQYGHGSSVLGFAPIGGLEESNLVLLFVVAFALSTDYGVFLFARIKEGHDAGLGTRDAVAQGVERTGRLITAAALLLCVAIGAFVTSHIFFIKELGVGAALAVLIDATVVRALLVPALIACLGERTWWAPGPLRRLHARIGLREVAA